MRYCSKQVFVTLLTLALVALGGAQPARAEQIPVIQIKLQFSEPPQLNTPAVLNVKTLSSVDVAEAEPNLILPPGIELLGGRAAHAYHKVKLTRGVPLTFVYLVVIKKEGDFNIGFELLSQRETTREEISLRSTAEKIEITGKSYRLRGRDAKGRSS